MDRLEQIARKHACKSTGKNIHVSLLVIRNKVISWGRNSYEKTHPRGGKNRLYFVHSELNCITRFNFRENKISRATLYNFRFSKKDSGLLLAAPCENCIQLCTAFGIRKIKFSTPYGMCEL